MTNLFHSTHNIQVVVSAAELKEFGLSLIDGVRAIYEQERAEEKRKEDEQQYLTRAETAEMLGVHIQTLWRWAKVKYLCPVKIGTKVRYRLSDVNDILAKGKEGVAV